MKLQEYFNWRKDFKMKRTYSLFIMLIDSMEIKIVENFKYIIFLLYFSSNFLFFIPSTIAIICIISSPFNGGNGKKIEKKNKNWKKKNCLTNRVNIFSKQRCNNIKLFERPNYTVYKGLGWFFSQIASVKKQVNKILSCKAVLLWWV